MRRVGDLFDRACSFENLLAAARRAARGTSKTAEVAGFLLDLEPEVLRLERELRNGSYAPGEYRTFVVRDPKTRQITVAPFRDRVVHHALCATIEPALERFYISHSYACRREKGTLRAVMQAQRLARRHAYFLKLDVKSYFHSIDHDVLCGILARRFKDRRFLDTLERIIRHPVPGCPPRKGLPIGNLTSQHLANFYLNSFDHFVLQELRPGGFVRYMDDMILFGDEKQQLWSIHARCIDCLKGSLRLDLRHGATLLAPVAQGLPFLGRRVFRGLIRMRRENLRRSVRRLRRKARRYRDGRIDPGTWERSLNSVFAHLSQADSHGDTLALRRRLVQALGADS
ncbi:MAG: RNA-dependent DNA polymerase [Candidatus Eisenbacteria bacterium]|nr:RNA-dependent DNA polymerase [Candidatus Eisenbacteria bacterium]